MIDAVIAGRIRGAVQQRTGANGRLFAFWRLSAVDKNGESVLCACIAFSESVIHTMLALSDGDSLAVSGELAVNQWQDKQTGETRTGLDVTVHQAMTAYHQGRKRKAQEAGQDE